MEREEEISASPFSRPEQEVPQTPAELLFAVSVTPFSGIMDPDRPVRRFAGSPSYGLGLAKGIVALGD